MTAIPSSRDIIIPTSALNVVRCKPRIPPISLWPLKNKNGKKVKLEGPCKAAFASQTFSLHPGTGEKRNRSKLTESHTGFLTASPQKGIIFMWHVCLTRANTATWGAEKDHLMQQKYPPLQTISQELQSSTPITANTVRAFSNGTRSASAKQHQYKTQL